jgi:invasion protein IalB
MRLFRSIGLGAGIATIGMLAMFSASAQNAAPSLPGGATSLREAYGDWVVQCAVPQTGKVCAMQQELTVQQSGQRVLAVEVQPAGTGATGTLVLPFGIALAKGATIQIDDGAVSVPMGFRTCLPAGCVVPVSFDAATLAKLRKATALKIKVSPDGGGEDSQWSVSLKGFATAYDRTAALLK